MEYMDTVDSRLERSRRESRVSQEWLAQVKVSAPLMFGGTRSSPMTFFRADTSLKRTFSGAFDGVPLRES